jgi:hypothetical protein
MAMPMLKGMDGQAEQERGMPDENVLPKSGGESIDKTGIKDSGYLDKKGTPSGLAAEFNMLPPGTNIEDQKVCDYHEMKMVEYRGGISFPGDGWT